MSSNKSIRPVPKENVEVVTVVAAVAPERASVNVSGPTTNGLNMPCVMEALITACAEHASVPQVEPAGVTTVIKSAAAG